MNHLVFRTTMLVRGVDECILLLYTTSTILLPFAVALMTNFRLLVYWVGAYLPLFCKVHAHAWCFIKQSIHQSLRSY